MRKEEEEEKKRNKAGQVVGRYWVAVDTIACFFQLQLQPHLHDPQLPKTINNLPININ